MPIIIFIFDTTHNIQLSYDYKYITLITYLHHMAKLHMLNVKWWIRNELRNQEFTIHYNKKCPYMLSDFTRFWVNS
jgi:hypothetical protein